MANHQLKITGTADFTQITAQVKQLTGTIDAAFGKDGISIFDPETMKFLRVESKTLLEKMRLQMSRLADEAKDLDRALQDSAKTEEEHNNLLVKRLNNLRQVATLHREMRNIQQYDKRPLGTNLPARGGSRALGMAGQQVGGVLSALPQAGVLGQTAVGIGSTVGMAAGLGGPAALALGGLAVAAGVATLAFQRMSTAFEVFRSIIPASLKGGAFGIGQNASAKEAGRAIGYGFTAQETMQQRLDVATAFGTQRGRGQQGNILSNLQAFSRASGVDVGQLTQGGNQLRATFGAQGASQNLARIMSASIQDGMDKSQASTFLSSTVGLLTQINDTGLQSNIATIDAMKELAKNNRMSPEQAARGIGGIQGAITGATGEAASYFQNIMAKSGVGRGSLLGSTFGVQQGLFGIDKEALMMQTGDIGKQFEGTLENMGLFSNKEYTQGIAKNILEDLDKRFGNTQEGQAAKLQFAGGMLQTKGPADTIKALAILDKYSKGIMGKEQASKEMKDLGKDEESRWREQALTQLKTIAGNTAKVEAAKTFTQMELGKESAATMNALTTTMSKVDSTIGGFLSLLQGGGGDGESLFGLGAAKTTALKESMSMIAEENPAQAMGNDAMSALWGMIKNGLGFGGGSGLPQLGGGSPDASTNTNAVIDQLKQQNDKVQILIEKTDEANRIRAEAAKNANKKGSTLPTKVNRNVRGGG